MRIRRLAGTLGIASATALWFLVEADSVVSLLILSVYILSPWAFLVLGARALGELARAGVLVLMAITAVVLYVALAQDDSSTGALVVVFLPIYQWAAIGVIELVAWLRRDREARGAAKPQ